MNQSFKRNLILGFGLSLLLLLGAAAAAFFSIRALLRGSEWVDHTHRVMLHLETVNSLIKDAETGQRGFLISRDPSYLAPYQDARKRLGQSMAEVRRLTADNALQQRNTTTLEQLLEQRLNRLQQRIDEMNNYGTINKDTFGDGQLIMDRIRNHIRLMTAEEERLLEERSAKAQRFATNTPVLIVVTSILSLVVAIAFFMRVLADYRRREALQQELKAKDAAITERIGIIENLAAQISAGNYDTRVGDEGSDVLGSLAGSLNQMAHSLQHSFTQLSQNEWLQGGIAGLNDAMIGEKTFLELSQSVINQVADYTGSQWGAFYRVHDNNTLQLAAGYALAQHQLGRQLQPGEELAGQTATERRILVLQAAPDDQHSINFTGGSIRPRSVAAIPVQFEGKLKAVIELASTEAFTDAHLQFFRTLATNTGIAINAARNRERVQELLQETQAQAEELQAQHSELENINTELEAQAEKLQASEEELRVQQEELQQANAELEERSRLLEERNNLILERNLEIQAKAEELELSTRYKSEFLANMSHELRTPLNSILLLSRLLSENHERNLSADQVEYARVIQSSGNGLLSLIDEILDLSKIESGKMELDYHPTPVEGILRDLNNLFAPLAKEKGIGFAIESSGGVPGVIDTDKLRLEQILRNLLSNALKFTAKGSVTLRVDSNGPQLLFAVKDTGIGIPADKQHTIFEAFQQADGSTRRKYGGTGLGLSISRELARLLGGEIRLHSEEGKGSTFTLTLPVSQPQQAPAAAAAPKGVQSFAAPAAPVAVPFTPAATLPMPDASIPDDREAINPGDRTILIIEDDVAFARSLLDYTRKKGYKGVVALRGDEGIALAAQLKPVGILLDVQLPVKNGWEVMEALKSNPATKPIPVHMMSSDPARHKSLSAGAVDFIDKPVAFEQLSTMFRRIEDALSKHPRKVLIVEEHTRHAQALALFLEHYKVQSRIHSTVQDGIKALSGNEADCVILDMGGPGQNAYRTLEEVKKTPGLEHIPIIIFTGRSLSQNEEARIRQYADSIVIKTAHSYQRILDEVSLFLHLVAEQQESGDKANRKARPLPADTLQGKTVLIADDDVRNIFSLTKTLEQNGMAVLSAMDGKDALEQLETNPGVDVVLLDMMMPEMDGYETARSIRRNPKWRKLPVIAVTAKAMSGDRDKCIEAGASDYITKPVDIDQLVSLLRVWLYQ